MSQALLLVDIQNDYFPGGAMELAGARVAGLQAEALLLAFRRAGQPVIHIQHVSTRPGATFFLPAARACASSRASPPSPASRSTRSTSPTASGTLRSSTTCAT